VLGFLVNQPAFDHGYSAAQQDALTPFNRWGTHRMKVCFEVSDANFHALFAEPSHALRDRCVDMRSRAAAEPRMSYSVEGRADRLDMDCAGATWITQTGFEDHDYILPTGEIAACPRSVEGTISPEGWIIGTLPLGAKYGRIAAGDVSLRLSRGEVIEVSGDDRRLCADVEMVLTRVPSLRHVSEIGVGMSRAIAGAAASHPVAHLWLERHFGFHLGLGARLPQTDHPDIEATGHHLDVVFAHGVLRGAGGDALLAW